MVIELALLCSIMAAGCYVVYVDILTLRIPNRITLSLFILGGLGQAFFYWSGIIAVDYLLFVTVGGFFVAFLLFVYGYWSAGDAKFYWAISVAVPPTLFSETHHYFLNSPIWSVFLNSLLVNFVITLAFVVLYRGSRSRLHVSIKNIDWYLVALGSVSVIGYVLELGPRLFGRPLSLVESSLAALVTILLARRFVPRSLRLLVAIPGFIFIIVHLVSSLNIPLYASLISFVFFVQLVFEILNEHVKKSLAVYLPITNLQTGMVPVADESSRRYIESFQSRGKDPPWVPNRPLTQAHVSRLRLIDRADLNVKVLVGIPFAPALICGLALSVIASGSVINLF